MIEFSFSINKTLLRSHMQDLANTIVKQVADKAPAIREKVVAEVTDNKNWNSEAVYSHLDPKAGQKYDLTLSGQLMQTIRDESRNIITIADNSVDVNIGDIQSLDALKSVSGSHPSERSANAPYWRFVVFGHKAPVGNFTFVTQSIVGGKRKGIIKSGQPRMKGTEPTYMFSNGLMVSEDFIDKQIAEAISKASAEVEKRWR